LPGQIDAENESYKLVAQQLAENMAKERHKYKPQYVYQGAKIGRILYYTYSSRSPYKLPLCSYYQKMV
jgi:hypothetical protein